MIIISQTKLIETYKLSQMWRLLLTFVSLFTIKVCARLILDKKGAIQRQSSSTSFIDHGEKSPTRK